MRVAFLFLPYIGVRDYSDPRQTFFITGPRFTNKPQACENCVYYRKEEMIVYRYESNVPSYETKHRCTRNMTCHGRKVWVKHPCAMYTPTGVLKKL